MDLSSCSVSFECNISVGNGKTQFNFKGKSYEVPFLVPITQNDGCLFGKTSNYIITEKRKNGELIETEVRFTLYYIELYENEFTKALADFKKLIALDVSVNLMKDNIIKAFLNLLDISVKSYNMAYDYIVHSPYSGFQGSFRQYCGLK